MKMRSIRYSQLLMISAAVTIVTSCSGAGSGEIAGTTEILVTTEAGDTLARQENVPFQTGQASGAVVRVFPERTKQTIIGIGSSFTESSAYVLAHLEPARRRELMEEIYGSQGANFSLARTHIGACDFSVEGRYSYADVPGDAALEHFSIEPDRAGFDPAQHPGIKDPGYDLLPMIQEALAIKAGQVDSALRIVGSAWTAPPWMKDIEDWYIAMSPENNWQGTGGSLKPEYVGVYSDYILRYLDAYDAEGVTLWGLTPVNEPHGNSGQWESMNFSPESQRDFVRDHLGPDLQASRHADTRLLVFDQNRDGMEHWADVLFADAQAAPFLHGIAIHWYSSTFKVYEAAMDRVHARYPGFSIVHTEGCIDDLGKDAPEGIKDPLRFKESGWFQNDSFWWNPTCTDWAYTSPWIGEQVADHPVYTPVHRYARDIIVGLDHWLTGWIDWNIVLDQRGGPNHVGNFCGAPIMIDTRSAEVYFTPIYHVLAQLSRTIRPGDVAVQTQTTAEGLADDTLHACATLNDEQVVSVQLLNTSKDALTVSVQIGEKFAELRVPANAVQTVRIQL